MTPRRTSRKWKSATPPTNRYWSPRLNHPTPRKRTAPGRKWTEKRMSDSYLKNVVEAALLAAARPVSVSELLQIFEEQSRPTAKEMRTILESLTADYQGRGVTI